MMARVKESMEVGSRDSRAWFGVGGIGVWLGKIMDGQRMALQGG